MVQEKKKKYLKNSQEMFVKKIIFIFLVISMTQLSETNSIRNSKAANSSSEAPYKILFVMDEQYGGNCEYIIDIFEGYGWEITTTAINKTIKGCSYVGYKEFTVNKTLSTVNFFDYNCVSILPGSVHKNLNKSQLFMEKIQEAVDSNIIITAWCRAVRLLARADIIRGRNITGKDTYAAEYIAAGATYKPLSPPIRDGNIITSVRSRYYRQQTCDLIKDTVENYVPDILDFSTYLGGTGDEKGISSRLNYLGDTAIDSKGNIIVLGRSASSNFPIKNAFQENKSKSIDVTITKYTPRGKIIFSTFFGGSGDEWGTSLAIDSENNIIFGGTTTSPDFPLKNPYQDELQGGTEANNDAFFAKLSSDGQTLIHSSFFGGTGSDWCYALALSSEGEIAITGTTDSTNLPLINPMQEKKGGSRDIYVTKFDNKGQEIIFSTYIGESGPDSGRGLGFDTNDNLYLTGELSGSNLSAGEVFQEKSGGGSDAFLASFEINGSQRFLTYLGGLNIDRGTDLVIDSQNDIIIAGYTHSSNFPTKNAFQEDLAGIYDVFVTKISSTGTQKKFSTYIGGEDLDQGHAICVDDDDNIIVVGETMSSDFPSTIDSLSNMTGKSEAFISILSKNGNEILCSTTLGGDQTDIAIGTISTADHGQIVLGFTSSNNFPVSNAAQETYGGNCDMFLTKYYLPYESSLVKLNSTPGPSGLLIASLGIISIALLLIKNRCNSR